MIKPTGNAIVTSCVVWPYLSHPAFKQYFRQYCFQISDQEVSLSLKCVDYIGSVDSDSHINIYAIATVKETGQRYVVQEPLWIEKPHIEIKVGRHLE